MPRSLRLLLCFPLLFGSAAAAGEAAAPPVEVLALFKDRALLRDATGEHLLKEGETSPLGVTLVEADATGARVRYRDRVHELTLSRHVSGRFEAAERQRVSINPDVHGQYRIRGAINGQFVNFLVDTGASVVAMSRRHAATLGIDPASGREGAVQTAQGVIRSHFVSLDEVTVGSITARNVQAAVIDGNYPVEILLGMSFLRNVGMEEAGGVLTLVQKH
ncbi:MAG TPA: retropepsin-like aspartic protease [Pseudomonadales bacterium]